MSKENKAKVRVFFAEFEGDNETIRDGLHSIAAAVNKTFQSAQQPVKVIAVSGHLGEEQMAQEVEKALAEENENGDASTVDANSEIRKQPKSAGVRSKKPVPCSLVKDLNLQPAGKQSLRDFYKEKKPKSQQETILLVLYYLCHVANVDKVSVDHVFTGMKDVQVPIPANLPQTIYTISSKKGWIESSDKDSLKTTVTGDNYVEHDLVNSAVV